MQGRHTLGVLCGLGDDIGGDGFKYKINSFFLQESSDWFDDRLMKIKPDAVKWIGVIESLHNMWEMLCEPAELSSAMTRPETEPR
jgi:hypothetical protein